MSASVLLTGCGAVESVIENERFATQRVNIFDEFDFIIALEAFMEAM